MASEALSDEQIDQLLREAESRLRAKVAPLSSTANPDEVNLETGEGKARPRKLFPKLRHGLDRTGYLKDNSGVVQIDPKVLTKSNHTSPSHYLSAVGQAKGSDTINDQLNAGPEWFGLPKTDITPQLKRDLQLIEMRSVLDPHRHYKKNNRKGKIPTFSQTGTVIEGATEFYSSRINKKDRTKNFVEEAIANERVTGRFKRKYAEIQQKATSGKKEHYKKLMAKRKKS